MAITIIDSATASAVAAATTQYDQAAALTANWSGSNVTIKTYSGATLRSTQVRGGWSINSNSPRELYPGALVSRTVASTGDITKVVFANGAIDIFSVTAGVGSGDISFYGNIKTLCEERFGDIRILTSNSLPAGTPPYPLWMTASVGEWAQLSGILVPTRIGDYSSMGIRDDETGVEILIGGPFGGHGGNNTNNAVVTCQLDVDSPSLLTRLASSDSTGSDITSGSQHYYTSDGRPMPRHTYQATQWSPEMGGYIIGGQFYGSSGNGAPAIMDLFTPSGSTGSWSAASPFTGVPGTPGALSRVAISVRDPSTGYFYATSRADVNYIYQFNPVTNTWTNIAKTGTGTMDYGANAFDTTRSRIYHLGPNGWIGPSATVSSTLVNPYTGVTQAISFNTSSAWTDFQANCNGMLTPALEYDETVDKYYYYNGRTSQASGISLTAADAGKIYVITPNSGTTWDMELLSTSGTPPPIWNNGVICNFRVIPRWKAAVVAYPGQDLYYVKLR